MTAELWFKTDEALEKAANSFEMGAAVEDARKLLDTEPSHAVPATDRMARRLAEVDVVGSSPVVARARRTHALLEHTMIRLPGGPVIRQSHPMVGLW